MTSTILFLTLLALLVLLIVAYRGDFAEPSILFVVGFTLAVFNGLTNYRTWDFDLSMQTCFVVGFGTFAFALTAYGVKVFSAAASDIGQHIGNTVSRKISFCRCGCTLAACCSPVWHC
ncbi:MAG: hypothetical protein ACLSUZ_01165 [Bifidobacterium pseudocatenulatum]